ncbi:MAG: HNH endonuclease [Lachnospiraceae bacterium]|nr:HNH endonuclease [Lachnospiraceae bacterium]
MGRLDNRFKEVIDVYNSIDDERNYRERGLENTSSNHGWYKCIKCGQSYRKGDMDIDHIVPRSLGGSSSRENLQCICKHCNRSKRDSTVDTNADLQKRKRELRKQDKEDIKYLKSVFKNK